MSVIVARVHELAGSKPATRVRRLIGFTIFGVGAWALACDLARALA